jgi:hypothetical protein
MLNSVITASMLSEVMSKFPKSNLLEVAKPLFDRANKAKNDHDQKNISQADALENSRNSCLERICNIQHEIVLFVSDCNFFRKLLPLTLEQIGNTYEATNDRELRIISMGLARIENAIEAFKNEQKRRKKIRLVAVLVSLFSIVGIGIFVFVNKDKEIGEIGMLHLSPQILLWSFIGSLAAILYRFTYAGDSELNDPLRWLFARPLMGVIMGTIAYLVLKAGFITLQEGSSARGTKLNEQVLWLIAFLAGFSDRFSDMLLRNTVGRFGGDKDGDLLTINMTAQTTKTDTTSLPVIDNVEALAGSGTKSHNVLTGDQDAKETVNSRQQNSAASASAPDIQAETKTVENKEVSVNATFSNNGK